MSVEEALCKAIENIGSEYRITELNRIWSKEIFNVPENEVKSTGYVVDTLEAAIWCCYNSKDYKEAVLKAVNLGGDTDTIAAVTGGLSGIIYEELPSEWVWKIRKIHLLQKACNSLGIITDKKFL